MLKVIHISGVWLPQTETWMYNQVKYLPQDIECHILCEKTENLDQFQLPRMWVLERETSRLRYYWEKGLRRLGIRRDLGSVVSAAKRVEARVLHSHFGYSAWSHLPMARKSRIKHVTTFYGADVNKLPIQRPIWRRRYRELFAEGDLFLCEGAHMATCLETLDCPREKIRVHHLGIEVGSITYRPRVLMDQEPLKVLIASSFTEKKGIPFAVQALGRISKDIPVEVTIIGDAMGGLAEKNTIMNVLEESGLRDKARLLGYQPHRRLFEEAYKHHMFLSPSVTARNGDTEGGAPVSIIEMAATGMPVVSTTHCDIPEVLNYGESGWLAQERDTNGLVKIIRKWLEQRRRWPELLAHARSHVEVEYDAVKQGHRLGAIYRSLCFEVGAS
jgi:colanic acid/amylovoran biosynthesis glycosyltransferase